MRLRAKLLLEKIPLLLLSVGTGIATLITQRTTVGYSAQTPLLSRLANAATACVTYIEQMFWPANLAVFDPTAAWIVEPEKLASKSKNTPFAGRTLKGKVVHTMLRGRFTVREGSDADGQR